MARVAALPGVALSIGVAACGGPFTRAGDLVVADAAGAVEAARGLVDEARANPDEPHVFLQPERLPASLRVPRLRYAHVHEDHVDLVLARNPDFEIGGRIWSRVHRPHRDQATKYPDIHFYTYDNDEPESPDNIR